MRKTTGYALAFLSFTFYGMAANCPTELATANGASEKSATLARGLDHFYNAEYEKSIIDFDTYILIDPNDPVGYWRKLLAEYFFFEDLQQDIKPALEPDQYNNIAKLANVGIAKAKAGIGEGPCDDFNRYIAMNMLGIRAILESRNDPGKPTWMAVDITLKEGFRIAKPLQSEDARFYLAAIKYELGKSGGRGLTIRLSSELPHNKLRRKALAFELAAKSDGPFADDARLLIVEMEKNRGKRDVYIQTQLKQIVENLLEKYPRNHALLAFKASHRF